MMMGVVSHVISPDDKRASHQRQIERHRRDSHHSGRHTVGGRERGRERERGGEGERERGEGEREGGRERERGGGDKKERER